MMVGGNKVVMMTVLPRRDKRDWTVGHSEMNTMMTLLIIVIIILIIVITSIILITIMRSTVYTYLGSTSVTTWKFENERDSSCKNNFVIVKL